MLLLTKMPELSRWMRLALKVAEKGIHEKYLLGAVVISGGRVISFSANLSRKTPNKLPKRGICAEKRACEPYRDLKGAIIYIARKGMKCSKPCSDCQEIIRKSGIRRMYYFNQEGRVTAEKIVQKIQ